MGGPDGRATPWVELKSDTSRVSAHSCCESALDRTCVCFMNIVGYTCAEFGVPLIMTLTEYDDNSKMQQKPQ